MTDEEMMTIIIEHSVAKLHVTNPSCVIKQTKINQIFDIKGNTFICFASNKVSNQLQLIAQNAAKKIIQSS